MSELKCTKIITEDWGHWSNGEKRTARSVCGLPAAECEFEGISFSARAILCDRHKREAEREVAKSKKLRPMSKAKAKLEKAGQQRLC